MEDTKPLMLVATVGGSPDPICSSLRESRPDKALFIVSEKTADAPSSQEILDKHIKGCEGFPEDHQSLKVPHDDPDRALALIMPRLEQALGEGFRMIADYTGGTKSMSAALLHAAVMVGDIDLRVMVGERPDHRQVTPGTERAHDIASGALALGRTLATMRGLVGGYSYGAALAALPRDDDLPRGLPKAWRRKIKLWRHWLILLDRWDRFDHRGAWKLAKGATRALKQALARDGLDDRLKALDEASGKPSAALCEDLWWNAQRRAAQGAYDDALARLYRLAEASVQARLYALKGIETEKVPIDCLPAQLRCRKPQLEREAQNSANGAVRLGLSDARELLLALCPESPVPGWWLGDGGQPSWQGTRNRSILAHGFTTIDKRKWDEAFAWFDERKQALWRDLPGGEARAQLPRALPAP